MNDSDERIKERVKEHYAAQTLPDDVLEQWVADAQAADQALLGPTIWQRITHHKGLGIAAAACVFMAVIAVVHNVGVHAERTERALKEVAMNHFTRLELEFKDSSIDSIDEQMVLLPFDMTLPLEIVKHYTVQGARYCSLSGQLAAHIKLTNPATDKTVSVFMTRAADELDAIDDSAKSVDGVDVKIWRESGLLYAMVGAQETTESVQ